MVHKFKHTKDEAIRIALMNQIVLDNIEFNRRRFMRCWKCNEVYMNELKKIDKKLKIDFKEDTKMIGEAIKEGKIITPPIYRKLIIKRG